MSLIQLNLNDAGTEDSTSATKAVLASAKLVFGTKGEAIVKRMEELVKVKELDTSKIDYVLDQIKTGTDEELVKWKKTASGKATITSVRALVTAKTLVQVINALRSIKVPRVATQTGLKGTSAPTAKTRTPVRAEHASRTNTQKELPKVNIASITPKGMNTVSQAQIDSIAAQLTAATGIPFRGEPVEAPGLSSSPWHFVAMRMHGRANPGFGNFHSIYVNPPFHYNKEQSVAGWSVTAETKDDKLAFGKVLTKPTAAALAKEIKRVLKLAPNTKVKQLDMPKTYKITELRRMTHTQRVAFTKKLNLVLGLDSLVYGISNNGESFKSQPGEEWEMQGHRGALSVFITFDGPYDNEQTGKWSVSLGDLDDGDQQSFTANDFDGMRSFILNAKAPRGRRSARSTSAYNATLVIDLPYDTTYNPRKAARDQNWPADLKRLLAANTAVAVTVDEDQGTMTLKGPRATLTKFAVWSSGNSADSQEAQDIIATIK